MSAIDVATGKQVWKFDTPQPERGGPTTTASGIGFVGGGDGNLRAFDVKTGKVLWTFQTGAQIADGPSIYSINGNEFIAIAVGGTPTSSSGGTVASQVQVFSLGGSTTQSPAPAILTAATHRTGAAAAKAPASASRRSQQHGRARHGAGRVARPGLEPELVEHEDGRGARTARRQARFRRGRQRGWVVRRTDRQHGRRSSIRSTSPPPPATSRRLPASTRGGSWNNKLSATQRDELLGRAIPGLRLVGYSVSNVSAHLGAGGQRRRDWGSSRTATRSRLHPRSCSTATSFGDGSPTATATR